MAPPRSGAGPCALSRLALKRPLRHDRYRSKAPKIEFPQTDYPIKVISDTGVGHKDKIIEIVKKFAEINDERVDERSSSNGKYTTIQLHIVATDQDQLYNINSELRATGFVHMVL